LRLAQLSVDACEHLLAEKDVVGSAAEQTRLIETYVGNPLALKIVAQTIVELFGSKIAPFLDQGEIVFGGVRELLDAQFARLSAAEQSVLLWLSILREPISLEELLAVQGTPLPRTTVLEAVEALRRRSLIEQGKRLGSFTLQSVILEFATARLITETSSEIQQGQLSRLIEQGLTLARSPEYVRQTQMRLIVVPLLLQLRRAYPERVNLEDHLLALLKRLRARTGQRAGIVARTTWASAWSRPVASLAAWCVSARSRHAGYDAIRGNPAGLRLYRDLRCHHHLAFGVEWSPDGRWLASSGWNNVIQIWDATTGTIVQVIRDPDNPYTSFYGVAWSPDGQRLACGNNRQEVQMWEMSTCTRQWIAREQPASARRVAWSPDGTLLVSAGDDGIVYIWNASDGRLLKQLPGHQGKVNDVAWSHDGKWLASGGGNRDNGELFVWDIHSGERVRVLWGHPGIVYAVAWSQNGAMLVSGGSDGMLHWWDIQRGKRVRVCEAHQGTVQSLKVSPDGHKLASCGDDGAIMLWNLFSGEHLQTLRRDRPYERLNITGIRGVTEAQKMTLRALGAFEETSIGE